MILSKFAAVSAVLLALGAGQVLADDMADMKPMVTKAINNKGAEIGTVAVSGGKTGVVLRIDLSAGALAPGWHGMHFHAVGDCSDLEKFKNSKAHVNHGDGKHGLLNPAGPENGDLPNLYVNADGSAHAEVASQLVNLKDGPAALLDTDGSALVIHAAEDDHMSQPIGNSGARLVCAVIR
nr:superoxide dismutase family protein [uncultured Gellertiella sp.]